MLSDVDPGLRPAHFTKIFVHFFFRLRLSQRVFCLHQRLLSPGQINFIGAFHCFGEHSNFIGKDLGKSPGSGKTM